MAEELYNISYLERTAQFFADLKKASYQRFLPISDGTVADIGCGSGADAHRLASSLDAHVNVIGFDMDERMIEEAQKLTERQPNLSFQVARASNLPLESGSLSGLRNERLIQHLENPLVSFIEFHRVLKPGHPIVTVETDWSSLCFYNGNPKTIRKVRDHFAFKNVRSGMAAAGISSYLKEAGFRKVELDIFPLVSRSLNQVIEFTRLEFVLSEMTREQSLTTTEKEAFMRDLTSADEDKHFLSTINLLIASAER